MPSSHSSLPRAFLMSSSLPRAPVPFLSSSNLRRSLPFLIASSDLYPFLRLLLKDIFRSKSSSWFQRCVYITNPESENASTITEINNSSKCTIGSYPISGNRFFSHLLAVSRQAFSRFQEIVIHFEKYALMIIIS